MERGLPAKPPDRKVLIVDDDPVLRRMVQAHLQPFGYRTVFASDGVTAVTTARRENPDIILLDIGLPGGDGFLVMTRLQQLKPLARIPVIFISASDGELSSPRAIAAGAQAFMKKPLNYDLLVVTMHQLLSGPEAAEPGSHV